MASAGSVSRWIDEVRRGDSAAHAALWQRYFPRLVRLAKKLNGSPRQMADEEDVALSVMNRFYRAAEEGRYPELADRDGLWRLLIRITARRAADFRRREQRQRRGGLRRDDVAGGRAAAGNDPSPISDAPDDAPPAEIAVMAAHELEQLLGELGDEELRAIAMAKIEGAGNAEIARQRNCSLRTIERRLRLIRDKWKHVLNEEG